MILIAESGSTKCDWVLVDSKGREIDRWKTIGFNPYFHSTEKIIENLETVEPMKVWADKIKQVWFYGAGCSSDKHRDIVKNGLDVVFDNSKNHVGHDLEAAAFALYSGEPFVACILGTGSNSCKFDGTDIFEATPSLSYVLGDEGSAGSIGKRIVSDYFYNRLPKELHDDFKSFYNYSKDEVLDRIYHKPRPNVFLAEFGPFAGRHADHPYIKAIVKKGFDDFIDIHVMCYEGVDKMPVSFVGSVAKIYEDILTDCLTERGLKKGRVLAKPVDSLVAYHLNVLKVLD